MKKLILLSFLMMSISLSINAQKTEFGIKAGYNLADLRGSTIFNEFQSGFSAGFFFDYQLKEQWWIQPELLLSNQGGKSNRNADFGIDVTNDAKIESQIQLSYLNLPLMLKYYPFKSFYAEFGPQIGLLIDSQYTRMSSNEFEKEDLTRIFERTKNDFDLGLNFGLGYKFDFGLRITARYNFGLTKITDDRVFYIRNLKNSVFSLMLGYSLF